VEVEGLIEEIFRNREEVYSASKAFLKDGLQAEEYLPELERFRREQLEALDRFYSQVRTLNPIAMANAVNRVRTDPRLANLHQIAKGVGRKLSESDKRLGEWAAMVLMERLKEAGEPPVPIAPRKAPEVVMRVPSPAPPADAIEVVEPKPEVEPETVAMPEPPVASPTVREPDVPPLVVPEPTIGAPQPEAPKAKAPIAPQVPVRREIDRAAIITAVDRAVVKVRAKRSPMEVYRDLDKLLNGDLVEPEQQLVFLCRLMMSYLLGVVNYEDLKELSEEYIEQLKPARSSVIRPEVRRLAVEAARFAEEREELKPFASFVQLYLSEANPGRTQEVRESWYRLPSS
jgi:hypothetical protein